MIKKRIVLLLSLSVVLTLSSCGKKNSNIEQSSVVGLEKYVTEAPEEIPLEDLTPDEIATNYISSLVEGDIETAYELVDVADSTFFSSDDFEYVVKRSDLSWVINNKTITPGEVSVNIKKGTAEASTYFIQSSGNYEYIYFNLNLDKDNIWKISSDSYVMSNVIIKSPIGTRLFLDDKEVKSTYLKSSANSYDYYSVPCVARKDWESHVVSSLFGDAVGELIIPDYDQNVEELPEDMEFEVDSSVSSQLFNELKQDILNMYNSIYSNLEAGSDISSIQDFISPNKSIDAFRPVYEKGIASISSREISDIRLVDITSLSEYPSFINSESEVVVNMGMELNWYEKSSIKSTNLVTAMRLEQVNGKWYLAEAYPNAWCDFTPNLKEYSDTLIDSGGGATN